MSGGQGRGRGQSEKLALLEEGPSRPRGFPGVMRPGSNVPMIDVETDSGSPTGSSSSGEKTIRGRGGFRQTELRTIPANIVAVRAADDAKGQPIEVLANFVRIEPMKERQVYAYRVDFEPNVESLRLRTQLFKRATAQLLPNAIFDGASEARSSVKLSTETTTLPITHPEHADTQWMLTIKRVSEINYGTFEMLRVYNMHMKEFLRCMQFFQVQSGAYIHPDLFTKVGQSGLLMVRGYRTAANVHEEDQVLMNLESVHKLIQEQNLLTTMTFIRERSRGGDMRQNIKTALIGKLVVTNYNKVVYRVEDVNFDLSPRSTFHDRRAGRDISYLEYYRTKHDQRIRDENQPLLLVVQNNRRRQQEQQGGDNTDIYVVPELCNMAGLTDAQRADNRLKVDLIKSSQIEPHVRVEHMMTLLKKLHDNEMVSNRLREWGYSYATAPTKVKARILPLEKIGVGRAAGGRPDSWPKVMHDGGFEQLVVRDSLACAPKFPKLVIVVARSEQNCEGAILGKLKIAFKKINLNPEEVSVVRITAGDSTNLYVQQLKQLDPQYTTCAIVLMTNQNKEKYNAIKKLCTCENGLITQVVTARLMNDERKANGAAIKIGIQIAAKIGGEPWYMFMPLTGAMVCGYDTYHDTAQRGRSYGAFVASMNYKFTKWFSKADCHDHLDELSSHMAENLGLAMRKYREKNEKLQRIFIYRDGVSDGQLEHVYNVELKQIIKVVKAFDPEIMLTFIVVNKRIGARFYMCNNNSYINPPPGSVIDNVVTRKERYDFYLVSQSTRHGVVTPTYYNIIYDKSKMSADKHQHMAFKMCFLYFNWTGTVRVPAPCQYAHKLALLCGEHLHGVPNADLDERLHFL